MISINTDEGECIVGRVRWIHFSDLHLGNDKATETRLMRRELPEYIVGLNRNFDYAFCTGDILLVGINYDKKVRNISA